MKKTTLQQIKSVCSCENAISLFTAKFLLQKYIYVQISVGYAQLQNFTFQLLNPKPKNTVMSENTISFHGPEQLLESDFYYLV
jgi:hypothetical protein